VAEPGVRRCRSTYGYPFSPKSACCLARDINQLSANGTKLRAQLLTRGRAQEGDAPRANFGAWICAAMRSQ
jgi:hypothetical protein